MASDSNRSKMLGNLCKNLLVMASTKKQGGGVKSFDSGESFFF